MSQPTLFGIPNCDTVRKARKWLDDQGLTHEFVDLRADTPSARKISEWLWRLAPSDWSIGAALPSSSYPKVTKPPWRAVIPSAYCRPNLP